MWQDLIKFERSLMINGRHDYRWSILKEKRYRNYWTNNLVQISMIIDDTKILL